MNVGDILIILSYFGVVILSYFGVVVVFTLFMRHIARQPIDRHSSPNREYKKLRKDAKLDSNEEMKKKAAHDRGYFQDRRASTT